RRGDLLPDPLDRRGRPPAGVRHPQGDRLRQPLPGRRRVARGGAAGPPRLHPRHGGELADLSGAVGGDGAADGADARPGRPGARRDVLRARVHGPGTGGGRRPGGGVLMTSATNPIVRVDRLDHYFYKGKERSQALQDINLEVMPREMMLITGPSGCGKTTLLT